MSLVRLYTILNDSSVEIGISSVFMRITNVTVENILR
jgi:hypothetical protein